MLEKIYVHVTKRNICDYEGFEEFSERAREEGIDVRLLGTGMRNFEAEMRNFLIITDEDGEYDEYDEYGEYSEYNEYGEDGNYKKLREPSGNKQSSVVRDKYMQVGLGMDYHGSAEHVIEDFTVPVEYVRLIYDRLTGRPHEIARTERIVMREMTVDDLPAMYELYATLADCPYIEQLYEYEQEKQFTINYIQNMYRFFEYGLWLVFERATGNLIGRVGIENREIDGATRQELGYLIHKDYQRQGYAYEACRCAIDYAREQLGIDELFICTHTDNMPSAALARRLGFEMYAEDIEGMHIYRRDEPIQKR